KAVDSQRRDMVASSSSARRDRLIWAHRCSCGVHKSGHVIFRRQLKEIGGSTVMPQAILFDLDDTLIQANGGADAASLVVNHALAVVLSCLSPSEIADAVGAFARNFWADPERHRLWRMRLSDARREIVAGSLAVLASKGRRVPPARVAQRLADRFSAYRDEHMRLFPEAHNVIDALRARGTRLALVTNGASEAQRAKIDRF